MARRLPRILALSLILALGAPAPAAWATSVLPRTVVDLIDLSDLILVGDVATVTDGFTDSGVPFTEVTVNVSESIRGNLGATYTFRQFGLVAPRELPSGLTYVGVTPDGWPRFRAGEEVVLFLYKAASITGFRTTVGLFQGKFTLEEGKIVNGARNLGLFRAVRAEPGLLTAPEQELLEVREGPVDATSFLGFVRRAVRDRWVETEKVTLAPR